MATGWPFKITILFFVHNHVTISYERSCRLDTVTKPIYLIYYTDVHQFACLTRTLLSSVLWLSLTRFCCYDMEPFSFISRSSRPWNQFYTGNYCVVPYRLNRFFSSTISQAVQGFCEHNHFTLIISCKKHVLHVSPFSSPRFGLFKSLCGRPLLLRGVKTYRWGACSIIYGFQSTKISLLDSLVWSSKTEGIDCIVSVTFWKLRGEQIVIVVQLV